MTLFEVARDILAIFGLVIAIAIAAYLCETGYKKWQKKRKERKRIQEASLKRLTELEGQLAEAHIALLSDYYFSQVDDKILVTKDGGKQYTFRSIREAAHYVAYRERKE